MGKDQNTNIRGSYRMPAVTFGVGLMLATGADYLGGGHWLVFVALLSGILIVIFGVLWGAAKWLAERKYRLNSIPPDTDALSEIIQIRNDVKQLIDMLSDFSSPGNQRDDVYERMNRIKMSDHSMWLDNDNLRQARKDFVHWCGVAQAWREEYGPTFRDWDDRDETLHYLNDAADRLDAGLKGNPVRSQQSYDQSGGE